VSVNSALKKEITMNKNEQTKPETSSEVANPVDAFVMPDVKCDWVYKLCGFVLSIPFFLPFIFNYTFFFERETWVRRKAFDKWMNNNKLPDPAVRGRYKVWTVDGYEITVLDNKKYYVFKGSELMLGSFNSGVFDRRLYRKIFRKLAA